jgi:hypothetical protein
MSTTTIKRMSRTHSNRKDENISNKIDLATRQNISDRINIRSIILLS